MTGILTSLPDEVLGHLVSFLTTSSLLAVCRTCKSLRLTTEPRIWRDVDLTGLLRRIQAYHQTMHMFSPLLGDPRVVPGRSLALHHPELAVAQALKRQTAALAFALRKRPERQALVRTLKIWIRPCNLPEGVDVLRLVSDGIRKVVIEPEGERSAAFSEVELAELLLGFASVASWPKLESISIPIGNQWSIICPILFAASPSLQHLTLSSPSSTTVSDLPPIYHAPHLPHVSHVPHTPYTPHAPLLSSLLPPWPCLPLLRSLNIQTTLPAYIPNLITCLIGALHLSDVCLQAQDGTQSAPWWEELVETLRCLPSLAVLAIDELVPLHWDKGGFETLESLTIFAAYRGCYGRSLESIRIPPLPNLKSLHYEAVHSSHASPEFVSGQNQNQRVRHPCLCRPWQAGPSTSTSVTLSLSPSPRPSASALLEKPMSNHTIAQLSAAPNLQRITFPLSAATGTINNDSDSDGATPFLSGRDDAENRADAATLVHQQEEGRTIRQQEEGINIRRYRLQGISDGLILGETQSHVISLPANQPGETGHELHLDKIVQRRWGVLGDTPLSADLVHELKGKGIGLGAWVRQSSQGGEVVVPEREWRGIF